MLEDRIEGSSRGLETRGPPYRSNSLQYYYRNREANKKQNKTNPYVWGSLAIGAMATGLFTVVEAATAIRTADTTDNLYAMAGGIVLTVLATCMYATMSKNPGKLPKYKL